jgi:hypothetical protein
MEGQGEERPVTLPRVLFLDNDTRIGYVEQAFAGNRLHYVPKQFLCAELLNKGMCFLQIRTKT